MQWAQMTVSDVDNLIYWCDSVGDLLKFIKSIA